MRGLALVALASSLSALVAASSASAAPSPGRLGTWVWDEATVRSSDARRDLLAFARGKRVDVLFVHAAAAYDHDPGFAALAALVEAASAQGLSITLVGGDPSWALPSHHADALAFIERARRLQARLAARGLALSGRVLFDVEPYLLPEWRSALDTTVAAYVELLRALQKAGRAASLDVWQTVPFWFPKHALAGRPLDQIVLEQSAGVVLMAYRNHAADVRALAAPLLARAEKLARPVVVAIETMCIEPPQVTFCGQSTAEVAGALDDIGLALRASSAFAGLAVHNYASWTKLEGRGPR